MRNLIKELYDKTLINHHADDLDQSRPERTFHFKIRSVTDQITKTIQQFDALLENHHCCSARTKGELSTALSEALANAIVHGNKINPELFVDLKIQFFSDQIILSVKDKGDGFDYQQLPDPLSPENIKKPSGRGVYLMSMLVDKVNFRQHEDGMEVELVKYLTDKDK
ncbi:MAG: ATP-binding protein [candidate division KSB1 bacterium]|nr:ATP-binding protein [candidate division KSB1 bacterium]MDZ7336068.1 ATP-binding protein [candidate division KSB1 bacterium]MDZ7358690.1 ATP-binding protein [candidate division KSB1 bacterium]MDZ7399612.1 ATP-binding protein [candidate division KSB1 bacterium]